MLYARRTVSLVAIMCLIGGGCSDDRNPESWAAPQPSGGNGVVEVPRDASTLQAAIDLARSGDTVLVSAGVYRGEGNRDLIFGGKAVVLKSKSGVEQTRLVADGTPGAFHRVFYFDAASEGGVTVDGFTISGGYHSQGGAIWVQLAAPRFVNCVFESNRAVTSGGVVRCKNSAIGFRNCTFVFNGAANGGTAFLIAGSTPSFERCIIAYGREGGSLDCSGSGDLPVIEETDIFGNWGGDWIDALDSLVVLNGNLSEAPLFCDTLGRSYYLQETSPCRIEGGSGGYMGALPPGCAQ